MTKLTSASDTRQEYIRKMNSKLKTAGIIVLCALLIAIPLFVTLGKKMTAHTAGTGTTASTVESTGKNTAGASTDSASNAAQTGASIKIDGNAMMDLWTDGAPLKSELISYMAENALLRDRPQLLRLHASRIPRSGRSGLQG